MKKYKDIENTLYALIAGVLLNGFIQGQSQVKINTSVVYLALEEIKKLLK